MWLHLARCGVVLEAEAGDVHLYVPLPATPSLLAARFWRRWHEAGWRFRVLNFGNRTVVVDAATLHCDRKAAAQIQAVVGCRRASISARAATVLSLGGAHVLLVPAGW